MKRTVMPIAVPEVSGKTLKDLVSLKGATLSSPVADAASAKQ
jgi:hypothetical protein